MPVRVRAVLIALLLGALMGASSASAQVSTGHSDWGWGNPLPQGEPLNDVSFADGVGYAVGDFGIALRSSDNGATWTNLPTGLYGNLTQVDAVSATTVIFGGGCVLRRSDDSGSTFVRLPWTASDSSCPQQIAAIDFPTTDTGYLLLAGGTILRTEDGGQSWARATAPPTAPAAIVFSSATTGFAAGTGIYMTTDGGTTWTEVDGTATGVSAIALDGPTGVVAYADALIGPGPTLYSSGDGGQTWLADTPNASILPSYAGAHLDCMNGTGCLLSGDGAVFLTTDGSTLENVTPSGSNITAAAFASPTQAVAVSEQGIPAVSSDGGATFTQAGAQLPPGFHRLRVSSGALATLSGPAGELALSSDSGGSWAVLDTPTTNAIDDTSFLTPSTGFALDSTGAVLRTVDGGSSWQTLSSQAGSSTILALDAEHVLVAGSHGIKRSADGGQTFSNVLTGANIDLIDSAGTAIVASGPRHAYVSTNGGTSWREMGLPPLFLRSEEVRQINFLSAGTGYLLGTNGRVFATGDGGMRWRELLALGHRAIQSIAFTSDRNGWAAEGDADGTPGDVLRTSDGGASWRPQRVSDAQIDELGAAGHVGYALDAGGDLFATNSAGDLGGASSVSLKAPSKAGKRGRVTVTGRVVPGLAGASVEINYRPVSGGHWVHDFVTTGGGGKFSLPLRIKGPTAFVAQWAGEVDTSGAGSAVVVVAR
jgi:photosystem II stability/assembly factor-like uncharacterized protein